MTLRVIVAVHNTEEYTDQVYSPAAFGFGDEGEAHRFYADAQAEASRLAGPRRIQVKWISPTDQDALGELLSAARRSEAADPRLEEGGDMPDTPGGLLAALADWICSPDGPPFAVTGKQAVQDAAFLLDENGHPLDDPFGRPEHWGK